MSGLVAAKYGVGGAETVGFVAFGVVARHVVGPFE